MGGEAFETSPPTRGIPFVGRPSADASDEALPRRAAPAQPPRRSVGGGGGGGGVRIGAGGGGGGGGSSQNAFDRPHPINPPAATPPAVEAAMIPFLSSSSVPSSDAIAPPAAPPMAAPVAVKTAMQRGRFSRNVAHPESIATITPVPSNRIFLKFWPSRFSAGSRLCTIASQGTASAACPYHLRNLRWLESQSPFNGFRVL